MRISLSSHEAAPTSGKQTRLGTDPWSFAAPSADGVPFLLDMATTTVAAGRIRNKANNGQTASYKAKCEHLAACYARLAEQFLTASIVQTVELPKP